MFRLLTALCLVFSFLASPDAFGAEEGPGGPVHSEEPKQEVAEKAGGEKANVPAEEESNPDGGNAGTDVRAVSSETAGTGQKKEKTPLLENPLTWFGAAAVAAGGMIAVAGSGGEERRTGVEDTWSHSTLGWTITFEEDGTYTNSFGFTGTWVLEGDQLTYTFDDGFSTTGTFLGDTIVFEGFSLVRT